MANTASRNVSLRLPEQVIARLAALSEKTGRSKTFYMEQAICEHLENLEDIYDAERELIKVRAGKSTTATLVQVMKRHGVAR